MTEYSLSCPFNAAPQNYTSECVFLEEMMENYYNLYSSCAHGTRKRPWYVALRRTGRSRRGKNARRRRKASHFLVVHYDTPPPRSSGQYDLGELGEPQPPIRFIHDFCLNSDTFSIKLDTFHVKLDTLLNGAVGGGATVACTRYQVPGSDFPPRPTKPSIPPGSVNWYQTCLGRIKR
ncbi:unnamed protein product [Heligmosomoides polygyrus]|uniref:Fibroblast growth factor n=1 Tax=Heligmosomoides polygyrus TaxID=6339 RepID=A0A3P8A8F0_HELPZ|nr:unnamed protein product [Heligmosomoides polygyrus]